MLKRTKPWAFLLLALSLSMTAGCFSSDDDDDDNGAMQNASLTQVATAQCNRTPEDEEPTSVLGLAYEGDPESETDEPNGSDFSNSCI